MVRTRSNDDDRECPICMDIIKFGAETNCGHLYCSDCILRVWDENVNSVTCISCPYCRQNVTLLMSCFTEAEAGSGHESSVLHDRETLKQRLDHYNSVHSQEHNTYVSHVRELPTILRHVWADLFTWNGLQWLYKLRVILCLLFGFLYAVFPFDFLPEAALGFIGLLDDVMVVGFLLVQVSVMFRGQFVQDDSS